MPDFNIPLTTSVSGRYCASFFSQPNSKGTIGPFEYLSGRFTVSLFGLVNRKIRKAVRSFGDVFFSKTGPVEGSKKDRRRRRGLCVRIGPVRTELGIEQIRRRREINERATRFAWRPRPVESHSDAAGSGHERGLRGRQWPPSNDLLK